MDLMRDMLRLFLVMIRTGRYQLPHTGDPAGPIVEGYPKPGTRYGTHTYIFNLFYTYCCPRPWSGHPQELLSSTFIIWPLRGLGIRLSSCACCGHCRLSI